MKTIQINNQHFTLHAHGGIYWKEKKCLLVADVHLGKSAHFRKNGSAIPSFTDVLNYQKLDELLQEFEVKQLIFLGDLFHSVYNSSWAAFSQWVDRQDCTIDLVVGNHDVIPQHHFKNLGISVHEILHMDAFTFTHHPLDKPANFNFCGHVHPGFRLRGNGRQYLNLACYYQQENQLILPAFGSFTGKYYISPEEGESIYVLAENEVFEV